jgi:hypothetical protein
MATYTGIDLTLLLGTATPSPAPALLMEAIQSVEVTQSDGERSGFQIVFHAGKGAHDSSGYPIVGNSLLDPFNRVVIAVNFNGTTTILMDGIITHLQLQAGGNPAGSVFAVTGEDVTVMMGLEQKIVKYPAQDEASIVTQILGGYSQYGLEPNVTTPDYVDTPDPNEYLPVQRGSDLAYVQELADRFGFVFFVSPGDTVGTNKAWWGPPFVDGSPQRTITLGSAFGSNTSGTTSIEYDALAPTSVFGMVQDRITDAVSSPESASDDDELPNLSSAPAITSQPKVRKWIFEGGEGLTAAEATARAQAQVDEASARTMELTGTLDSQRFGGVLKARSLVDVRGAASAFNGKYYVRKVKHRLTRDNYQQDFTVSREGLGSTITKAAVS